MASYDSNRELIRRWFVECLTVEEVAKLYANIMAEAEKDLTESMLFLTDMEE